MLRENSWLTLTFRKLVTARRWRHERLPTKETQLRLARQRAKITGNLSLPACKFSKSRSRGVSTHIQVFPLPAGDLPPPLAGIPEELEAPEDLECSV